MFSIIISTRRDFESLKPLFAVSCPEAEIIIIDSDYNDKTKRQLQELKHEYYKVTYAAPLKIQENTKYKRDLVRCHNTGFAIAENEWIIKLDDTTELKADFFEKIKEDIKRFKKSVIRPVKLESWAGDNKWSQYHILKIMNRHERFIELPRHGLGNNMFITLDQAIFPRDAIDALNGNDERFDIGHGWEDANLMQRFISLGYKIILDQELKTFQTDHVKKLDPIDFSRLLYQITQREVEGGKYRAYNPYDIKKIREKLMPLKHIYEIKNTIIISGTHPVAYSGQGLKKDTPGSPPPSGEGGIYGSGGAGMLESGNVQPGVTGTIIPVGESIHVPQVKKDFIPKVEDYPFDKFFSKESLEKNEEKILSLRNKHRGEDLFILGNSPDITKEFIDKVRDKTTFAANGFIVCKDIWNYEPTYMVITNQGVWGNHLRNMRPDFKQYEGGSVSDLFLTAKCDFIFSDLVLKQVLVSEYQRQIAPQHVNPPDMIKRILELLEKHVHIKVTNPQELKPPFMPTRYPNMDEVSFNLEEGTYTSSTVILDLMLPAAAYMGFKNIYLKGCSGGGGHFYDISPRHFWDEKHQKDIYELYGMFRQKLNSIDLGINIYNLDRQISEEDLKNSDVKSRTMPNPKEHWDWDGTPYATRKVLGKDPWFIEYKNLDDVL